jgi:hypothetical protein
MPVIYREAGWSFVIFPDDHPPPHVHAQRADADVKAHLRGSDGDPEVVRMRRVNDRDAWRALAIVYEYQDEFLEHWRLIHG